MLSSCTPLQKCSTLQEELYLMQQNHDSPTPEQTEAMKQATAFAWGYSLALANRTGQEHYQQQSKRLEEDLELFGCFIPARFTLRQEYLISWQSGRAKALAELEKLGL
jgi:hypothetical protein